MPFRGGPVDARVLPVPVTDQNREWYIPTVDGVWLGDCAEPLPDDLSTVDFDYERYWRVGGDNPGTGEFVHEALLDEWPFREPQPERRGRRRLRFSVGRARR